jgi:hypothetical protein
MYIYVSLPVNDQLLDEACALEVLWWLIRLPLYTRLWTHKETHREFYQGPM